MPELFFLSQLPLSSTVPPFAVPASAGALVTFDGIVRDHNEGKRVSGLEYSAYAAVAQSEGNRIVAQAIARFDLVAAACVHRTGALGLGEGAVRVWAAAAHRREAFAACEYIIDQVKTYVPIWKRETYADGTQTWVQCSHEPHRDR